MFASTGPGSSDPLTWPKSLLLSPECAHILFSQGCKSTDRSQGLQKIIRGRPHYYEWHAFVNFWRLCFVHVWVCVASSFLFWCLGRKFFWWPWKPHWNTRFIIPVVFWIMIETWEQLNLCLSQAWLELKSYNSHFKNPLLGSGLERKSVLQNKDRKWPSSLGSRSNTDDYSMSGAAFPAHAGEWDNDTVFICTAAKVTG